QGTIDLEASFEAGKKYMAVLTMSDARPLVLKAPIQVVPKSVGTNAIYIVLALAAIGGVVFFVLRQRHRQAETV
ncbi:MAG: QVPTGV class sortase B protein-sorting domain-containing protein, partial [Gammaproteobacteria bacterium]